MNNVQHALDLLTHATEQYSPCRVSADNLRLEKLGLFLSIRELQVLGNGQLFVFISEFTASQSQGAKGITITCAGSGENMNAAVASAALQWTAGVLPALALWRNEHSCLASDRTIDTKNGVFQLVAGPVIARGVGDNSTEHATQQAEFPDLLIDLTRTTRFAPRVHWIESFASKFTDGAVDATCRLDNRDWNEARQLLNAAALGWPPNKEPLQTLRQFTLLIPQNGNTQDIILPSFWKRVFGRG
jgi:Family of unknown function (DUF6348)